MPIRDYYGNEYYAHIEEVRKDYPRAYFVWMKEDEKTLRFMANYGATVEMMAGVLQRQESAIVSRLEKLGLDTFKLSPPKKSYVVLYSAFDGKTEIFSRATNVLSSDELVDEAVRKALPRLTLYLVDDKLQMFEIIRQPGWSLKRVN